MGRRRVRPLREAWLMLAALACFGALGLGLFWETLPRGPGGWLRLAVLLAVVLLAGGLVAPTISRAVRRK